MIDLVHLLGHVAQRDRAGHIGAVAVVQAAEIHGDEIAVLQNALGRNAVRQAGVGAGDGDGVERRAFGAVFVEPVDQLRAQLLFRHARMDDVQQIVKGAVGDLLRLFHVFDLPRLLACARSVDLGGVGMQDGVELRVVERIFLHGQRIVLKADGFDGVVGDGLVDQLCVRVLRIDHLHGKARQVFLCRLNIAEVGEIIALRLADDGDALCDAVFRGILPVVLRGQQQRVDLALCDELLVLFNVFHVGSSIFRLQ